MAVGQKIIPVKGMNLDLHESKISPELATYIKNLTYETSNNPGDGSGMGSNRIVFKPLESNTKYCDIPLPDGENYCMGGVGFDHTNEGYVFGWNSLGNHFIYRIKGTDGKCEMVYKGKCLNFQLNPLYFIDENRCWAERICYFDKVQNKNVDKTLLLFTDNFNWQRCIWVEASIETNSFDPIQFPFFAGNYDKCELINLAVPQNLDCVQIKEIAIPANQSSDRSSRLRYNMWQFRVKRTYIDGRPSEHGIISDQYFITESGCISTSATQCLELSFSAGNPAVDKLVVEYKNCGGLWVEHEVLDKYDNSGNKKWWERSINPNLVYDAATNTVKYKFCANKTCLPIAAAETDRNFNPISDTSSALFKIGAGIGLANNKYPFQPVNRTELEKITFDVVKPLPDACQPTLRKVTVYGLIYTFGGTFQRPQRIKKHGDYVMFAAEEDEDNAFNWFKQYFPKGQEGFIMYDAGNPGVYAISKQCRYEKATGDIVETGVDIMAGILDGVPDLVKEQAFTASYIPLQKWEFFFEPSVKVLRIASHQASPADDYSKTSTHVTGRTFLNNPGQHFDKDVYELVVDCTAGDVEVKANPMMIMDLTRAGGNSANAHSGYLYEDEVNKVPIEGAAVICGGNCNEVHHSTWTDHNGFYFGTRINRGYFDLYSQKNCQMGVKVANTKTALDSGETHFRSEKLYVYKGLAEYLKKDRNYFTGRIQNCAGVGIAGVSVVLQGGAVGISDNTGTFKIIAHNRNGFTVVSVPFAGNFNVPSNIFSVNNRNIYVTGGKCFFKLCGSACNYFIDPFIAINKFCNEPDQAIDVGFRSLSLNEIKVGLQNGGKNLWGILLHDGIGRHTFVQRTEKYETEMPSIQETGAFAFSKVNYAIDPSFAVNPRFTRLTFVYTANVNFDNFLTWFAEKVDLIDDAGKINTASPTKIRIWFDSLNEYNSLNGFSTNSTWGIIDENANPVLQDEIEIIANGDGKLFTKVIRLIARYSKEGRYVIVDYDDQLKDLKNGALIKFVRPKKCQDKELFYEICNSIVLEDGKIKDPAKLSGTLNAFDSYFVYRNIPVPYYNSAGDKEPDKAQVRTFPFPFEHHSPSDLWGTKCANRGRVAIHNPYEAEICKPTEIALSGALSGNGVLNYLGYLDDKQKFSFDPQGWGGITAVLVETSTVLVICEFDNFLVGFNDNELRATADGKIILPSAESKFGKPQKKIGNNWGCQEYDRNTIRRRDGLVHFLDKGRFGLVQHNFADAVDISDGVFKGWLTEKIKHHRGTNKYFHGAIDPLSPVSYLLSEFELKGSSYVNNEREIAIEKLETMRINILTRTLLQFASFTPEYFITLDGDALGPQIFSFKNAVAWSHHRGGNPGTFNTFFGQKCDKVFEVVFAIEDSKKKKFLFNEVHCKEHMYFADLIQTASGQVSRLLKTWWNNHEFFWSADFKCDLNTLTDPGLNETINKNKLLDGDLLYGEWIKVRYIGDPDFIDKYSELISVIIFANESAKSGT